MESSHFRLLTVVKIGRWLLQTPTCQRRTFHSQCYRLCHFILGRIYSLGNTASRTYWILIHFNGCDDYTTLSDF